MLLLNGPPASRLEARCSSIIWPVEVWFYAGSDRIHSEFLAVFYRRWGAGPFRIWNAQEGLDALFSGGAADSGGGRDLPAIANGCRDGDKIAGAIGFVFRQGMEYSLLQARMMAKPDKQAGEWVTSFNAYSTDLTAGDGPLPAKLGFEFPGRYQNRTVMEGVVSVPVSGAGQSSLAGTHTYDLLLNGELLQNGQLFDSFRYKFDFPAIGGGSAGATLPLVFQRFLRPGDYTLIVKVEDINSGKAFREERAITVPSSDRVAAGPPPRDPDSASARILQEANAAISTGDTTLKLVRPFGELQTGMQRFDTLSTGDSIDKVTFALDGKPVLTKQRPPYSVELDLGALPRPRRLTVAGFDAKGDQVAGDEMLINSAANRFQVRLAEPQRGKRYENSLLARAEVSVPDGQTVERVEFYLNEALVATAYQEPYQQPILLPKGEEIAYVRAVAYLADGNSTESLVFVNAPENMAEVEVNFVELYATVLDRNRRPVEGLEQKDFAVTEDGVKQEVARFERVADLPIHAAVTIDISASMEKNLDKARASALQFLQGTIQPKDRAAVVTFNDHPNLTVKFTNDLPALASGLAGLKAERGTALYDSIIFTLYYFTGRQGAAGHAAAHRRQGRGEPLHLRGRPRVRPPGRRDHLRHRPRRRRRQEEAGEDLRGDRRPRLLPQERRRAGRHLLDDRERAALAVPGRLPVDQHHQRQQHLPRDRPEGEQAGAGAEDDPRVLPVAKAPRPAPSRTGRGEKNPQGCFRRRFPSPVRRREGRERGQG